MKNLAQGLAEQKNANLYRRRDVISTPQGTSITIEGKSYLSFCSNDYLGLANHPQLVSALQDGAERFGVGSGAAHLLTGHGSPHHDLENDLAEFTGRERALLFSTGYMANLGVISALTERNDAIYEDRLNHASLIDGALLSRAKLVRYQHVDVDALKARIQCTTSAPGLVATDAVFSMDGNLAPLPELASLCRDEKLWLMVDDAHGLGVLGEHGRGSLDTFKLSPDDAPILVGTLGKAFGTFGAFVAGSHDLIETLIQKARTYIFTTAIPPAVAHATRTSLQLIKKEGWRRARLVELVDYFRAQATARDLELTDSPTPIQPLIVGDADQALSLSAALRSRGLLIPAIRPPTVPQGTARLRITFSANHTKDDVDRLLIAMTRIKAAE